MINEEKSLIDVIDLFEGDIRMDKETRRLVKTHYPSYKDAAAAAAPRGIGISVPKWDVYENDGTFIVPYVLDGSLSSDAREAILQAAEDFAQYTCIRLEPRTSQEQYITYFRDSGCYSPIGRRSSNHRVSIGNGCEHKGIAIHETMHSLGFWHEQSRPDRDDYVIIHYENIRNGMDFNFEKRESDDIDSMGSPYDLQSVMHYQSTAFSTNGQRTISTIDGLDFDAQRDGFARTDIEQINAMYGCGTIPTTTTTSRPVTITPGPITTTSAPVTPITIPPMQCNEPDVLDKRTCSYLSQNADCTDTFMHKYCCQSCKNLGGTVYPPPACVDRDVRCKSHAARGFCQIMPSVMFQICQDSCGFC